MPYHSLFKSVPRFVVVLSLACVAATGSADAAQVDSGHIGQIDIAKIDNGVFGNQARITQLAFGPGPDENKTYVYSSSPDNGVRRAEYDPVSGFANSQSLSFGISNFSIDGLGIAVRTNGLGQNEMYLSEPYSARGLNFSQLWKVLDHDSDGDFTDDGTETAAIVRGIPRDDHGLNNIQIVGNSLYVGNGVRTRNGDLQTFSGDTFGESAYGGTILTIQNLDNVATANDAAGFFPATPGSDQYGDLVDGTDPAGKLPLTSTADNKLRAVATGARNPFGLAVDKDGDLYFSNNWQRVENHVFDRTNLGPDASLDAFGGDGFSDDIHDNLFRVEDQADYGYRNGQWQSNADALAAGFFDPANAKASITFDNWVTPNAIDPDTEMSAGDPPHDPTDPDGLGPSSSANGLDFYYDVGGTSDYDGLAFVTRWNGTINDGGQSISYEDIVTVDVSTGEVDRVVFDLNNPLDALADGLGNILVAEWNGGIWQLSPMTTAIDCPEPCIGNLNGDDAVNFGDLTPFVLGLTDIEGYDAAFPQLVDTRVQRGDVNEDGEFNFGDLTPFANLLTGADASGSAVPEPSTCVLLLVGALLGCGRRVHPACRAQ